MYIFLFVIWVILNGKITVEIAVLGAVICAALYGFMCRYMDYGLKKELQAAGCLGRIIKYLLYLTLEIIKANVETARIILTFDQEPDPVLVRFGTGLKTTAGQTALANSITLTPGTITADLHDGRYLVHSLDRAFAVGIHESGFVERIGGIEEKMEREAADHVS